MENLRIGVCGNIGVGKSTLVKAATECPLSEILLNALPSMGKFDDVHSFPEKFKKTQHNSWYVASSHNLTSMAIDSHSNNIWRKH